MVTRDQLVRATEAYLSARDALKNAVKAHNAPTLLGQWPEVYGYLRHRTLSDRDFNLLADDIARTAKPLRGLLIQSGRIFNYPERNVRLELSGKKVLVHTLNPNLSRMEASICSRSPLALESSSN